MNLQSSFTYDNFGRRTSRTLQMDNTTVSTAGRSYDTFGRIALISNGTDTLSYTYRPGGQLSLSGWRNAQNDAMSNQSYEYDQYNRLISIKLNNANEVSYTLNAKDQRTAATYANAGLWNFTYDDKGQVTGANGSSKSYTYSYDGIGNRLTANENSAVTNYTSNLLNQYTLINSAVPNYDADGNMTSSGNGWVYTYNGENRITQATKGSTTVTMAYDYAGRRISKTVTVSGVVQNSYKYVYDGFKLIAVYNNNDLVMTFTWQPESLGMDVPVSMTYGGSTYYYVTDGNKNVTALLDASGNRVAEYIYGPFGQTVSATGAMAQINPFRFSSEFHDDETGLVYYNYRYYSPEFGRWTKRDPIEEDGGSNLYGFCNNSPLVFTDNAGTALYAVDGTWHDAEDEAVVRRFFLHSYESPKEYYEGPDEAIGGSDSHSISSTVLKDICDHYAAFDKNKQIMPINLVGWSRGATIVIDVSNRLKTEGCCCNGKRKYPSTNWIGLFDAVSMMAWGTWPTSIPQDTKNFSHIMRTDPQTFAGMTIFPQTQVTYSNKTNVSLTWILGSKHSDIGGSKKGNNARIVNLSLILMIMDARNAGVKMLPIVFL